MGGGVDGRVCQHHKVNTGGRGGRWERKKKGEQTLKQVQVFLWSLVGSGGGMQGQHLGATLLICYPAVSTATRGEGNKTSIASFWFDSS